MATVTRPDEDVLRLGPNIPHANIQLPGVAEYEQITRDIQRTLYPTKLWFAGLSFAILCMLIGAVTWAWQVYMGLGVAGYSPPVMWGVYIVTFVFWVGIGHAGTLI
ncbi:MAG: NrfD/PsrC family molybdoenzyme membrane anchor subunit, partial [Gemmatimonadaceae bacterium]